MSITIYNLAGLYMCLQSVHMVYVAAAAANLANKVSNTAACHNTALSHLTNLSTNLHRYVYILSFKKIAAEK